MFAYRLLEKLTQQIKDAGRGISMIHVTKSGMEAWEVMLPPLKEQKRIAAILDQADALRRQRQAALDHLNTLGQSIFYDMFGDLIQNSMSWPISAIGDLFDLKHGFAFKSENFLENGRYTLLTPGNFHEEGGFKDRGNKQRYHDDPVPKEYVLHGGDLLVAMTEQAPGLLGSPIFIPETNIYLHNQRLGRVLKKTEVESSFIFEMMNSYPIRMEIQRTSTGTKVKHTSPKKISSIQIGVPSISLQNQFATIFEFLNSQKANFQNLLEKSNTLFDSLQQRAFRGEL